jgi:hypothetical protein
MAIPLKEYIIKEGVFNFLTFCTFEIDICINKEKAQC